MPVFNEEKYIAEAVASVLDFKYPSDFDVQLIIVDDFSNDQTSFLLKELREKYKFALNVKTNKYKGKNYAFNEAFCGVVCDYVCFMGGDDKLIPAVLVSRVRVLQKKISDNGAVIKYAISACKIQTFSEQRRFDGILIPKKHDLGAISGGSVMIPFELAKIIFPLPVYVPNEDTWLSLHLRYRDIEIVHVGDVGLLYRIHANNSHKRGMNFAGFKSSMWARGRIILLYYVHYSQDLPPQKERKLLIELVIECLKSLGSVWSIIFLTQINLKEKMKVLTYASPVAYYLKQKFYKYLVGR